MWCLLLISNKNYVALDIVKYVPDCWVNEIINKVISEITNYYSVGTMLSFYTQHNIVDKSVTNLHAKKVGVEFNTVKSYCNFIHPCCLRQVVLVYAGSFLSIGQHLGCP